MSPRCSTMILQRMPPCAGRSYHSSCRSVRWLAWRRAAHEGHQPSELSGVGGAPPDRTSHTCFSNGVANVPTYPTCQTPTVEAWRAAGGDVPFATVGAALPALVFNGFCARVKRRKPSPTLEA